MMATPAKRPNATRKVRAVPPSWSSSHTGSCIFFAPEDAPELERLAKRPLLITPQKLTDRLNLISENYLTWYALFRAGAPDSKAAEWSAGVARTADELLRWLGVDEPGYPLKRLPVDTAEALTRNGGKPDIGHWQTNYLGLGETYYDALDKIPAALWLLRLAAQHAEGKYRKLVAFGGRRSNARQPQNVAFLRDMAGFAKAAFGLPSPSTSPNPEQPFFRLVEFVRARMAVRIDAEGFRYSEGETDAAAARQLRQFTGQAAASLWKRERSRILREGNTPAEGDGIGPVGS